MSSSVSSSSQKTQILITSVPKTLFSEGMPKRLESRLFEDVFPQLRAKVEYFTPLPFLNRVVIILADESATREVYDYLRAHADELVPGPIKLFMTESLLASRSRSFDDRDGSRTSEDAAAAAATAALASNDPAQQGRPPILSLDTNPKRTGVQMSSLSAGSPSLSPDRSSVESPTLLKFNRDEEPHYYQEPRPGKAGDSRESLTPTESLGRRRRSRRRRRRSRGTGSL
ncbi:Rcn2p KNAG_0A03140 [Huiozyma naganishii CBS 8797]|uniref:Uncharacterized protein n=1 Tax=Huiozyma naganishii (strain ATCC MYA-139 / BCRC 22969 / CBS 8797 / KCTC 17520 / NBRC 10181 / NCYC 3082 / Yp74L-3) TaxID=1071383 RepID=J7RTG2_HUIN7|nr:hypothetical protein KNAG_0A03140 [Kazachstania naganishii CBS 8797]CCK68002.1 hypothetical protein KNAG_0A03140 [Kazachstania naganishii CBS 8797]